MKVAVIGGNGFLGSKVYDQLLNIYKKYFIIDTNTLNTKGPILLMGILQILIF